MIRKDTTHALGAGAGTRSGSARERPCNSLARRDGRVTFHVTVTGPTCLPVHSPLIGKLKNITACQGVSPNRVATEVKGSVRTVTPAGEEGEGEITTPVVIVQVEDAGRLVAHIEMHHRL